ncbi:YSC84-related protein [Sandaracinus amylolyticus]|uniref:lipid-binding SYLF domain-containing protein n=1 Tax=Sandaracinus amylolyticus TaxID=927083 RepID=UPI001F235113|nr:lipid-binding SYLF domain-containing protein [Sandaracinus amylolyticus]UJR78778.1 Ysc84 domain-containing protein [Sandaracinus amylolyticus]
MKRMLRAQVLFGLFASLVLGCASAPESRPDQRALEARADGAVQTMTARDPTLRPLLARSAGYIVFPEVTEGGFIVGGAQSVGVVYENGRPTGYAELRGGTVGAQIGGQSYSQLVVFDSREALNRMRAGNFDLTAGLTATAIQSGAAAQANFENGTAVFIDSQSGLMAGATVGGESISYISK